jgi:hypothetical protein
MTMQNTFRYLATKKIKQIADINKHNIVHKRHQYNLKQIKTILEHDLTVAKADKGRTMVIRNTKTKNRQFPTRKPNKAIKQRPHRSIS